MKIDTRISHDVVIFDINGEIDLYNSSNIKDKLRDYLEKSYKKVIINLDRVTYIDSSGIGSLISSQSTLKKINGALRIINIHDSVKRVFELTKLTSFFKIYEDEESAMNSF